MLMVFRKGCILRRNLSLTFQWNMIEIVNKFVYLGISFSTGCYFTETHKTLSGQALKAIFKLSQYRYKCTDISPKHTLELFDKLITPILTYGGEIWGFSIKYCYIIGLSVTYIVFVSLHLNLLLCWHSFHDIILTLSM